jgi:predicted AAA+ superfamily ATPase
MINRTLQLSKNRSCFLFGPRQTGKSTYVRNNLVSEDLYINLLPQRNFLNYQRDPNQFRQEVLAHHAQKGTFTCVVDEIQKIPALLDEVHDLIESYGIRFILTGSSARKLKRGAANLLAGRANTYHLYPCTYQELGENFDLEKTLALGTLPYLWSSTLNTDDQTEFLRSYVDVYLREEIQAEGVVRNIAPFVRFIDVAANNDGELVNYTNIARECGVSVKTIQEYYQILEDTFLAYRIDPWMKSIRKRLVSHPRYYLFDTGVTNALCQNFGGLNTQVRGRRFEQFIILQLIALNHYYRLGLEFFFWRTNTGVEIDLILTHAKKPIAAIEIKSNPLIENSDAYALREFKIEYPELKTYVLCPIDRPRLLGDDVQILPWQSFLTETLFELLEHMTE